MIEEIKVEEIIHHNQQQTTSSDLSKTSQLTVQIIFAQNSQCPANIVKPSSLNYKIGLKAAAEEFLKKESKIEDYQIVVEEYASGDDNNDQKVIFNMQEDLDDALYQISVQVLSKLKPNPGGESGANGPLGS